jgi:amidase
VTQLHDLTALEQARAIASRSVSAIELAEHYLRRSEALSDTVGAFISLTPELALQQARAADAAVAAGRGDLGPLHGVVAPIKDLNLMAGVQVRAGSAVVAVTPDFDEDSVALLRAAGMVCTGTTNAPEFGLPCYTENAIAPPARTPWDLRRSAGGSSGGAAAAVATGLAPLALGSDGGGSIRIPASVTGLVGIKPSRGLVSNGPGGDEVGELVVQGPLARTVADAAAMLDVLAGPGGSGRFLAASQRDPGRLRIGRYCEPVIAPAELDPAVLEAYESASALLADLGHEVIDIARPFGPDVVPQFEAVWSVLALLAPVPADAEAELMPLTRWLRQQGAAVTGLQLAQAVGVMRMLSRQSLAASAHVDVVLCPSLAKEPALVGGLRDDADPAADFEAQKHFTPFTSPYNISGQPSISLPLQWTAAGLPIGVQIVGRPSGESTMLSLAGQLERARPWMHRRHELW